MTTTHFLTYALCMENPAGDKFGCIEYLRKRPGADWETVRGFRNYPGRQVKPIAGKYHNHFYSYFFGRAFADLRNMSVLNWETANRAFVASFPLGPLHQAYKDLRAVGASRDDCYVEEFRLSLLNDVEAAILRYESGRSGRERDEGNN